MNPSLKTGLCIGRRWLVFAALVLFISGCLQNIEGVPASKEGYTREPSAGESETPASDTAAAQKQKGAPLPSAKASDPAGARKAAVSPESTTGPKPERSKVQPDPRKTRKGETPPSPSRKEPVRDSKKAEPEPLTPQKIQLILDEALDFCQAAQDFWQKGELENAIEALDQAYMLILKIDDENTLPELLQQKEDLRFTISKRILEIYASRNIVVNGSHNEIPTVLNHHVMAEVHLLTKGREKDFFIESYRRSGRYRPYIVEALSQAGLPTDLSWLPLIESGFKVNALSRARALGLWQFIPSTGYKFGLKRDFYIDERLDPEKSTRGAIDYLKELHQIFGDWTTVLAAYNCGEGRVLRVIRSQNINYLDNFWDLYERLPRETARYVPRFLATLHIIQNASTYGINKIEPDTPWEYDTVTLSRPVHLRDLAKTIDVSEHVFKDLNPELRYQIVPPNSYELRVPKDKKDVLMSRLDDLPVAAKPRDAQIRHRVWRGETLSTIAKKYGTTIHEVVLANNIQRRNHIVVGQTLSIPQKGTVVYRAQKYQNPPKVQSAVHVVKGGDSLWIIAKQYGTTTGRIQEENNLRTTRLQIGQVLRVPKPGIESSSDEGPKKYRVRRGDSPFRISKQHNMTLEHFLRINRLTPRSKIYPGQLLLIE